MNNELRIFKNDDNTFGLMEIIGNPGATSGFGDTLETIVACLERRGLSVPNFEDGSDQWVVDLTAVGRP